MPALTTLVLGAGASCSYGYPTGRQLRNKIIAAVGDLDLMESITLRSKADLRIFRTKFSQSNDFSIDHFLAANPMCVEIGKIAIAKVLLECEKPSELYEDHQDHWYAYLSNILTKSSWGNLDLSWLTIVNFNYDRSFEVAIQQALFHHYEGRSLDEVKQKMSAMKIHHVYGNLMSAWQAVPMYRYGVFEAMQETPEAWAEVVRNAAKNINVIDEHRDDRDFEDIRNAIQRSNRIAFLGFGFDATNVRRISTLGCFGTYAQQKFVVATCRGMKTGEIFQARKFLFPNEENMQAVNMDGMVRMVNAACEEMLRETGVLTA